MIEPNVQEKKDIQNKQIESFYVETQAEQKILSNNKCESFLKKKAVVKHIFPKCIVCKKPGKYQCPKCKVRYCSLQHYRSHNLFCSQQFYQQNVNQHLKGIKVSKQQRQKTKKIVQEHDKQLYRQDIVETISQERFQQILKDLQQNGVQNVKLSYKQQLQFAEFIKQWVKQNGEKPFWQIQDGLSRMFIDQCQKQGQVIQIQQYNASQYPEILTYRQLLRERIQKVIPFNTMKIKDNAEVSTNLIYQITYIVYLTAVLFRYFDGEHNTLDFRNAFSNLSEIIFPKNPNKSKIQIQNFEEIVIILKSKILKHNYDFQTWCNIAMQDCKCIIKNKYLVLQLLYRVHDSFFSKNNVEQPKIREKIIKKLQFLISYTLNNWSCKGQQIKKICQQTDYLIKSFNLQ